jgi:acyl-coenzyme A thioesterase PaaI-like protein
MTGTHQPKNPHGLPDGALPWTKSCLVCGDHNPHGFKLRARLEGGRVVAEYTTKPHDTGYKHLVHGGVIMTLLDEVMTWATILETRGVCVAAEMTTRLREPVTVGHRVRIEAWVTKNARRIILTEARALDLDTGKILTEATGKYIPVAAEQSALQADDFVHSPTTIPPEKILPTV